jgi:hypothetical protein
LLRWAIERSMYANVNFLARDQRGTPTQAPWIPEDFLGEGDREQRSIAMFQSQMAAQMENLRMLSTPVTDTDRLPIWARSGSSEEEEKRRTALKESLQAENDKLLGITKEGPAPADLPPWATGIYG